MVDVSVGIAAAPDGTGVAYARIGREAAAALRVPFAYDILPDSDGHEIAYAGLAAVCRAVQRNGIDRVRLAVEDPQCFAALRGHAKLPRSLAFAYIKLGCALNGFRAYELCRAPESDADLAARARSEAAMRIAA